MMDNMNTQVINSKVQRCYVNFINHDREKMMVWTYHHQIIYTRAHTGVTLVPLDPMKPHFLGNFSIHKLFPNHFFFYIKVAVNDKFFLVL